MAAEVVNSAGRVLTVRISGQLTQPELASMQTAAAGIMASQSNWRVLVLTEKFTGWERGGNWDDFSFQAEHDAQIERMAIVGERRWEGLALIFTAKGLRKFPIEYFEPAQLAQARAWLGEH